MPPDLGAKYTCFKCASKFYDLHKPIPLCPKCGADQRDTPPKPLPSAAERTRSRSKPPEEEVAASDDIEPAAAIDDDDEDNAVEEDLDADL